MKFTRETGSALMIRSVDASGIRIGDDTYETTIVLTVDAVLEVDIAKDVSELTVEHFSELLDRSPEVIVLGTGQANIFPPRELVFAMARHGVGFETMDTGAAARTYNVLASEGRQVAAVLFL